jgi:fatty acid desaturase
MPALRSVAWRDLSAVSKAQAVRGLLLTPPWLALSLLLAGNGLTAPALLASSAFFMAGLRQAHDGFHRTLGLPRGANEGFLFLLSLAMAIPLHAVKYNHLRHHAHPLADDDVEGAWSRLPGWRAAATGPLFTVRMLRHAFAEARGWARRWMVAEAAGLAAVMAVAVWADWHPLRYHLVVMVLGNCLTGFFAVWLVHHDCDASGVYARTQRGRVINALTLNLLYHMEHHLFPAVPAYHLPELARRIDAALPTVSERRVVGNTPNRAPNQTLSRTMPARAILRKSYSGKGGPCR